MKKLLAAMIAVAFVFTAVPAMATSAKVPKTLCLTFSFYSDYQQLSLKKIGTITDSGSKVTTYSITGTAYNGYYGPVTGSGYVIPGTNTLHASFNGTFGGYSPLGASYELFLNLASGVGTWHFAYYGSSTNTNSDTAYANNCSSFDVPGDAKAGPASAKE